MNRKTEKQLNCEQTRVPTPTLPLIFTWSFLMNALIVKSLVLSPPWRGWGEQLRNNPHSKLQNYEDRTSPFIHYMSGKALPSTNPLRPDRPVTACTARLWPPAPKIQLPLGSQGRAAERFFFFLLWIIGSVAGEFVLCCTHFAISLKKRKRLVISAPWLLKCFSFIW